MPRFTLHGIWASGPTYKVGLMLSLAGEPFDYEHVDMMKGAHKSDDYRLRNPFGVVPCLFDSKTQQNYCQSAAILEHVAEATGKFFGKDKIERQTAREWVFWGWDRLAAGIYRPRGAKFGFLKLSPEIVDHYKSNAHAALKDLDSWLATHKWVAGETMTFADIDLYGVVAYASQADISLASFENLTAWMKLIEELPGYLPPDKLLPQQSRKAV